MASIHSEEADFWGCDHLGIAERALAARHLAYSQDLLAKKILMFAGRTLSTNEDGSAIVEIQINSEEETRTIIEGDATLKSRG